MSEALNLSVIPTIGLYEFARQLATTICPPPHHLSQVFAGKWVTVLAGKDKLRLVTALSPADFEVLQRLCGAANITPLPTQSGRIIRQLYRRFREAEGRPAWVPILRTPPNPPHVWGPPRSWHSPEHLAIHQTHIQTLSDWVAEGRIDAVDQRTGLKADRVDIHTRLLQEGVAKYLKEAMRGSVSLSSFPCVANPAPDDAEAASGSTKLAADPVSIYSALVGKITAPEGAEEWSFQITGRRLREQWTEEHDRRLHDLATHLPWAEVKRIYLQKSDSKLQERFYAFRRRLEGSDAPAPVTLDRAWHSPKPRA